MISGLSTFTSCSQLRHNLEKSNSDQGSGHNVEDNEYEDADHGEDGDEEEHVGGEKQEDRPDVNPLKVRPATNHYHHIHRYHPHHMHSKLCLKTEYEFR